MIKLLHIIFLVVFSISANAQIERVIDPQKIDVLPHYEGENKGWDKYLKKNLEYPKFAKKNGIQGTVYIEAEINDTGIVSEASIFKGLHISCDTAALKVVRESMWFPGQVRSNDGQLFPIKTRVTIPIVFK